MNRDIQGAGNGPQAVAIGIFRMSPQARLPEYQSEGASGADVYALLPSPVHIAPGQRVLIPTGIVLEIPAGFEAQVRPRSGNALKYGLVVLNSPGTIDSDYRGELKIIVANLGSEEHVISSGDRIAQVIFVPVWRAIFAEKAELSSTSRGEGGFGSTGRS